MRCIQGTGNMLRSIRARAGDPLELLEALHSIEILMIAVHPLMMMRRMTSELSLGRGGSLTEIQMMVTVVMR
jgi:hypothetical protein